MKIIQITPGAGNMICGACLRDHALARAINQMGHSALMVPLYLPPFDDDEDVGEGFGHGGFLADPPSLRGI